MKNNTNKTIKYLFSKAHDVTLEEHEHAAMARELFQYMDANPLPVSPAPVRSRFIHSPFSHTMLWRTLPVMVIVLLVGTGGLSYAAQQSLPGDVLYPLKVSVNERVEGLFVVSSPNSKVQFEIKLAGRRLQEAEQLAVSGKLDDEKRALIENDLDKHVAQVSDHVAELAASDDLAGAADISKSLQTSLVAHQETFAKITASDENSAAAKESVVPLIAKLESKVEQAAKDQVVIEAKISTNLDEKETTAEEQIDIDAGDALFDSDTIDTENVEATSTTTGIIPGVTTDVKIKTVTP